MKVPVVPSGHPDHYRFDNPSSVAAADNYAMGHWRKRRIADHLRIPHDYASDIHQIINYRALFQYIDRGPAEHRWRRLVNAELERHRRQPLTMNQQAIARMDSLPRYRGAP